MPATYEATGIDPRCAPMTNLQSDVAVQLGDLEVAGPFTLDGVTFDPLLDYAWLFRSRKLLLTGDIAGAGASADEVERVQALYPKQADAAALEARRAQIEAAQG